MGSVRSAQSVLLSLAIRGVAAAAERPSVGGRRGLELVAEPGPQRGGARKARLRGDLLDRDVACLEQLAGARQPHLQQPVLGTQPRLGAEPADQRALAAA